MTTELEEVRKLIEIATFPGVIEVLKQYERSIKSQESGQAESKGHRQESVVEAQVVEEPQVAPQKEKEVVQLKQDVRIAAPLASGDRIVYVPITDFLWDQNGYDSPTVTVYVELEGVGSVKDNVTVNFTKMAFDLQILGLNGKNYRLLKDNLDKDIDPAKSKIIVKKNKVVVKLQKIKGQYSYEHWANLTSKKTIEKRNQANKDPSAGIMDMMKDMYDDGDDSMKKIIGEAMMKSKSGEKMDMDAAPPMPPLGGL